MELAFVISPAHMRNILNYTACMSIKSHLMPLSTISTELYRLPTIVKKYKTHITYARSVAAIV